MVTALIDAQALATFKEQWPCHGIPDDVETFQFEYDAQGDLIDYWALRANSESVHVADTMAGGALLALSHDALNEGLFFYTSGTYMIELRLTRDDIATGYHSGSCDDDVALLRKEPRIAAQLDALNPETVRNELQGYGAWDETELSDPDANLTRILWLACGDLHDELPDTRD